MTDTKRRYWLFKTEPSSYSWTDLVRETDRTTFWDGIRNYQARNIMRDEMKLGDRVLVYHSVVTPQTIEGIAEVVRTAYPDPSAWDRNSRYFDPKASPEEPRWVMVDIRVVQALDPPISRDELKSQPGLEQMMLLRKGSRLSIQPVTPEEWAIVLSMRGLTPAL